MKLAEFKRVRELRKQGIGAWDSCKKVAVGTKSLLDQLWDRVKDDPNWVDVYPGGSSSTEGWLVSSEFYDQFGETFIKALMNEEGDSVMKYGTVERMCADFGMESRLTHDISLLCSMFSDHNMYMYHCIKWKVYES